MVRRLNIMALRCPDCGQDLSGLANDVVFHCPICRRAYELSEDGFLSRPVVVLKPRIPPLGGTFAMNNFYLPVWAFDVTIKVEAPQDKIAHVNQIIAEYNQVFVCGFRMWRPSYFGNPGFLYTSNRIIIEQDTTVTPPALLGCGHDHKQAIEFIKPFLLAIVDRKTDVAFIDVKGEIKNIQLLQVPFSLDGDKVRDTQINWQYPVALFEDMPYFGDSGLL